MHHANYPSFCCLFWGDASVNYFYKFLILDKQLSLTIKNLRVILALLVVYIHLDYDCPVSFSALSGGNLNWCYHGANILISQTIARLAVPLFFCMSGYLFFRNIERLTLTTYFEKVKKRFHTLVIPYVIWNILATLYSAFVKHEKLPNVALDLFSFVFLSPADFPLWFMRDLIMLVLLSPLVYYVCRSLKGALFSLLLVVYLLCPNLMIGYLSIGSIMFFSLGGLFAMKKWSVGQVPSIARKMIYCMAVVLGIVMVITYGERMEKLLNLYLLIGSVALLLYIYNRHFTMKEVFVDSSFFVFASHKLGFTAIAKQLFSFIPNAMLGSIASYLIAPFIVYALCSITYSFIKRFAPKVSSIINGR